MEAVRCQRPIRHADRATQAGGHCRGRCPQARAIANCDLCAGLAFPVSSSTPARRSATTTRISTGRLTMRPKRCSPVCRRPGKAFGSGNNFAMAMIFPFGFKTPGQQRGHDLQDGNMVRRTGGGGSGSRSVARTWTRSTSICTAAYLMPCSSRSCEKTCWRRSSSLSGRMVAFRPCSGWREFDKPSYGRDNNPSLCWTVTNTADGRRRGVRPAAWPAIRRGPMGVGPRPPVGPAHADYFDLRSFRLPQHGEHLVQRIPVRRRDAAAARMAAAGRPALCTGMPDGGRPRGEIDRRTLLDWRVLPRRMGPQATGGNWRSTPTPSTANCGPASWTWARSTSRPKCFPISNGRTKERNTFRISGGDLRIQSAGPREVAMAVRDNDRTSWDGGSMTWTALATTSTAIY